jgi:hypothetical protein
LTVAKLPVRLSKHEKVSCFGLGSIPFHYRKSLCLVAQL